MFFCISVLVLLIGATLFSYRKNWQIWRWRRALQLNKHELAHNALFKDVNGFALSQMDRVSQDAIEYVYGEIEWTSFIALLSLTKPNETTVFYDLGSGVGKTVIACSSVFGVAKSCGIELMPSLHEAAKKKAEVLAKMPEYQSIVSSICFIKGNFLDYNLQDATLIFINSTAFFGDVWVKICQYLEIISSCQIIITTSKIMISNAFVVDKVVKVQMNFGVVSAFIHKRLHLN